MSSFAPASGDAAAAKNFAAYDQQNAEFFAGEKKFFSSAALVADWG